MRANDWRKTQCCGTCKWWDAENATDIRGGVHDNRPGPCNWPEPPLPHSFHAGRYSGPVKTLGLSWMCRSYGVGCPCWEKRER